MASHVQSVIFSRDSWNIPNARKWLKKEGFISNKVDTTVNYHRFRQHEPKSGIAYYTLSLPNGIKLIIERP